MSFSAGFSSSGFSVTADNAIDLIVGTEATGAGYVGANIQAMSRTLHADNQQLMGKIAEKSDEIMAVNQAGFAQVDSTMRRGFSSLKTLSGVQIAVQAAGFAIVATQLHGMRKDLRHLAAQADQLVRLQRIANQRLDQLVDIAQRSLEVQEKILDALLTSRTVEAQQLLRQGWENLKHGYEGEALARFEQSLQFDNTVFMAHAQLARLYRKRGDKPRAEDHYVRATKFSTSVNAEVHALACLEYATFLEDEGRFSDCIAQLRYVLQHSDKPTWRFHLAELLARTGQAATSLAELRRAIESDDEMFAASMASQDLTRGLGADLVRLLADLDEARRRVGFAHLAATCVDIDRLDAVAALESPVTAGLRRLADGFREDAAATLRAHIGATYAALPGPTSRAYELRGQVAREADVAPQRPAAALLAWVGAWDDAVRRYLFAQPSLGSIPWSATGMLGILAVIGGVMATVIGLSTWGSHGWDPGWLVVYEVSVPLVIGVAASASGVALVLARRRAKRSLLAARAAAQQSRDGTNSAIAELRPTVMIAARSVAARWAATIAHPVFADLEARLADAPATIRASIPVSPQMTGGH